MYANLQEKIPPRSRIGKRRADEIEVMAWRLDVTLDAVRASAALLSKEEQQRAAQAQAVIDPGRFYGALRENGNQYDGQRESWRNA